MPVQYEMPSPNNIKIH